MLSPLLASLFPEGTERSLCSRCVCRGGKMSVRLFVRPSAAVSPLSSWSISMKLSGYIFGMAKIMHMKFFQDRERRFFLTPQKGGFRLKE